MRPAGRRLRPVRRCAWAFAVVAALPAPAPLWAAGAAPGFPGQAAALHVDMQMPLAADTNPGTRALPLRTIGRAVELAAASAAAARPRSVVVHPGVYREAVTITAPLVLAGQPGAEIRGSDVWSAGWSRTGAYWTHPGVPRFQAHGVCDGEVKRCLWPEQVFYDGKPLLHVGDAPAPGQFAVTGDRTLVLADPPDGHLVEVTTRTAWVTIKSDDVTVRGFRMRHAANDAQTGAITADGYSRLAVLDNVLSLAHGAVVSLSDGRDLRVAGNEIGRAGQLGVHLAHVADALVRHNRIYDNNTAAFSWSWEAGGLKATRSERLTVEANDVSGNDGPGLWCDGDCRDVVIRANRVHDNSGAGIHYEISHSGRIVANVVWKTGLAYRLDANHWGWGAGILIQNSNGCQIDGNTLAWNRNGIIVLEQDRGPAYQVFNTSVHDNTIISQDAPAGGIVYALAWLADHPTGMYAPSQGNTASSNRYGYSGAVESGWRFAWRASYSRLAEFNATPGGKGGRYLSRAEQNSLLASVRVPLSP